LDLLERKKLTLLNPKLWEDKNDTEVILKYKNLVGVKSIYALCLSSGDETVHHWKTFANGSSGCCIEFSAQKLFNVLKKFPEVKHRRVEYKKLSDIRDNQVEFVKMPFTKRHPYRCEEEYRLIVENDCDLDFYEIEIPLNIINKITISQHMPQQIYNTIKTYLQEAFKDPDKRINRSTLYENKRWIGKLPQKQYSLKVDKLFNFKTVKDEKKHI